MLTVITCITNDHDLSLVCIAAIVCIAGSVAGLRLFERISDTTRLERAAWLVLAAIVVGASVWSTHFIAMLGYSPGVPISFDAVLTVCSMLICTIGAGAGFALAADRRLIYRAPIGGAILGIAVAAMHYSGMLAYRVQGIASWDMVYVVVSIVLSALFSAMALHTAAQERQAHRIWIATGLMTLGIVSLHFTGMAAFHVEPLLIDGSFSNPDGMRALAIAVAAVATLVIGAGVASNLIDMRARDKAAKALTNMSNGLLMISKFGTIQLFNDRVLELFDLKETDIAVGMPIGTYLHHVGVAVGWESPVTQKFIEDHRTWISAATTTRLEHQFKDGRTLHIVCRPIDDGGAIITYDDVTEAREGQRKVAHMAFHDALTGLPNRRSFADNAARLAQLGPFTMLMIDLDRFKAVNDNFGHATGDDLLTAVAQRMRQVCGPADLLFRLGGDEFAVLTMSGTQSANALANAIIAAVSLPFQVREHAISIGCSIGLADAGSGASFSQVQKMADLALYKAKDMGRNRVELYRHGMMEEAAERLQLEKELGQAVEAGELELFYQPLYNLPGRDLCGFEALLRWRHPKKGMVSPAEFIPIAEQTGAIVQIGAWVIEQACRQIATWGKGIYVSVNVSPVQLRTDTFPIDLAAAMARHKVFPRQIEIEITETAMVDNSKQIAKVLTQLRALGVRIAMDDFGTGYSSLAHLREFELDRIKIDRSFISAGSADSGAAAVVRAVTSLAKEMSISTTGEGVESEEQLANLISLGCETAQGYLLGRPLDATAATAVLANAQRAAA